MSCEDCLSRRAFLARSTLAVAGVAALTTGCGDGQIGGSGATGPLPSGLTLKVSTVPALATVGVLAYVPPELREGSACVLLQCLDDLPGNSVTVNPVRNGLMCNLQAILSHHPYYA